MGKSFAEYQAEHLREPFPLPMPDGAPVMLRRASINDQAAMAKAAEAAREAGEWTPFTGIEVLVSAEDAARIAEAWGAEDVPPEAWDDAMGDMRKHFGLKN